MHREIFRELLSLFGLCLGSLLALILIGRILQLRELFLGLEVGLVDMAMLFVYLGPFFLLLIVPIACMLSVFLTFLRMSTDRELVALKAGGLSLYQMLPAPVLFCILCTLFNLFISFYGLSWGMGHFRSTIIDIAQTRARIVMQPGVFNQSIPGITVYARQVDNASGRMEEVMVEDRSRGKAGITIIAPEGRLETDKVHGDILVRLNNGKVYRQQEGGISVLSFDEYVVRLDLNKLFKGFDLGEVKPKEMSWESLGLLMTGAGEIGENSAYMLKVAVEMQKRIALPFACIVLGLFAMPLACAFEGLERQMGVVLALLNFLVYYSLLSVGLTVGESGIAPPAAVIWLPNLLFMILGVWGLRRATRERSLNVVSMLRHIPFRLRRREREA
ncbi:LPS export ABC transporter permease LptF [Desulfovibrio psychrotolerans]|uniref:LPS export ABC transporter permease LptF n=1 Tax=Desulfovibrio psychrotolerans TaxID=415242 RepID=A0A7J0BPL9_9BACT|nr:LPS export ABC transporter permease LptF [Desulfovibrio psychrotolerans]GFM35590.1 LPS export ABC transporter permease LptF [Desulfovibrio psychrotolerans]